MKRINNLKSSDWIFILSILVVSCGIIPQKGDHERKTYVKWLEVLNKSSDTLKLPELQALAGMICAKMKTSVSGDTLKQQIVTDIRDYTEIGDELENLNGELNIKYPYVLLQSEIISYYILDCESNVHVASNFIWNLTIDDKQYQFLCINGKCDYK